MSKFPWYQEGLRFECTGCGKCCTGPSGYVWLEEEEMENMSKLLKISLELFIRQYTRKREGRLCLAEKKSDHSCIFLKDNRCSVYSARPKQCQTFPWWKENLQTEESWKAAALFCEGIHSKAPLVSNEVIEKNLYT